MIFGLAACGSRSDSGTDDAGDTGAKHVHEYEVTDAVWAEDHASCEITLVCKNSDGLCENVTVTETASSIAQDETEADCTTAGSVKYTATLTYEGDTYTAEDVVETTPALGHTIPDPSGTYEGGLGAIEWGWTSRTNEYVTLKLYCAVCGELADTQNVAYETNDDDHTLSASVTVGGYTYSDVYDYSNDAGQEHEHNYVADTWIWTKTEEGYTCVVTLKCEAVVGTCDKPTDSVEATIVKTTTKEATCGEDGEYTYTAAAEVNGVTLTDTKTETIPATGEHTCPSSEDSEHVTWMWGDLNGGSTTVSIVVTCTVCNSQLATSDVTLTVETIAATCQAEGTVTYTATATIGNVAYTDAKTEKIPKLDHKYPEPETESGDCVVWNWAGKTDTTVRLTVKCTSCGETLYEADVAFTSSETAAATCAAEGVRLYKATVTLTQVTQVGGNACTYESEYEEAIPKTNDHTYPDPENTQNIIWHWDGATGGSVTVSFVCTVCGSEFGEVSTNYAESSDCPGYWEASVQIGEKTYTGCYEIPVSEEKTLIVEVDFDGGRFTVDSQSTEINGTDSSVKLVYSDGQETGFTVMGSTSDAKVEITTQKDDTQTSHTVLKFNGGASTSKSSLAYYLDAGTYMVEISYFQGSDGRWATVFDATGKDVGTVVAEEDKTSGSAIMTREIIFRLDAAQNIYIGSKSSGLYITYIAIYSIDTIPEKTVTAVALDVDTLELEIDEGAVISAVIELSDGKTYVGYTGGENGYATVAYEWSFFGDTNAIRTDGGGASDNLSVYGSSVGTVTVNVTVNGTFSATCVVTVVAPAIPELGDPESDHTYPDPDDAINVVWGWEERDDGELTVTVTIYCVDCGEILANDKATYSVWETNSSYWYAEVAEGGRTYTGTYKIPGEAGEAGTDETNYDAEYTVKFHTNQQSVSDITRKVFNYSVVTAPVLPSVTDSYFVGWYMDSEFKVAYDFSEPVTTDLDLYAKWDSFDSEVTYIEGAYESIAVEFRDTQTANVRVYYKLISEKSYTLMTDADAVRMVEGEDNLVRVDIMGLQGDKYYNIKILTSANQELLDDAGAFKVYVTSYDRSGYAHFEYDDGVGAYNDDGTLKDGALVIYVTEENKNDVTDDVYKYNAEMDEYEKVPWSELSQYLKLTDSGDIANYNRFAGTEYDTYVKGIGEILNNSRYSSTGRKNVGIKALCDAYGAVVVRIIGEVKAELTGGEVYWGYDDEDKTYRWMVKGSYDIIGLSDLNPEDSDSSTDVNGGSHGDNGGMVLMRDAHDITIEGVGEGAILNGWGITFIADTENTSENIKSGKSFEVRNLTFINYPEDAIGVQGTQTTVNSDAAQSYLTASAERIWIHNNTFYSGYCQYPAESDKGEGDGTCDFKRGQYFTLSYNYFEGCHKTDLFGADDKNLQFNISMHHNFWYNCQSRIPMARNSNIHYYNNYVLVDDATNIQYVMDARANAYIYAEYNYFEGCKDVFRSNDGTGTIKSYGNVLDNCSTSSSSANIEPTVAETRGRKVENNCGYQYYGIDYSSFDTDSSLFYYDDAAGRSDCHLTSAEEARAEVMQTAGAFSRDKIITHGQLIKSSDVEKPVAPSYDLDQDPPTEENDGETNENSVGVGAYAALPDDGKTKRY